MNTLTVGLIWGVYIIVGWAFYAFYIDRVIRYLHEHHHDVWVSFGRPNGHLYRARGGKFFASQRVDKQLKAASKQDNWVRQDPQAARLLKEYIKYDHFYRKSLPYALGITAVGLLLAS